MKLPFTKMQGCGNDYIYINCFEEIVESPEKLAVRLSDRHFGIGADGVILILPSETADARMRMFNADGSEGKMCGNGIRCVAKYVYDHGIAQKSPLTIETLSGIKTLELTVRDGLAVCAKVDMGRPALSPAEIPVRLGGETVISRETEIAGGRYSITCVSMGNPHAVIFCPEIDSLQLTELGPKFENAPLFPEKVNTEFIEIMDALTLRMRVWERGSGETLACGTGACASVVAAVLNGFCPVNEEITVHLLGGDLQICYTGDTVYMTGSCETVFEGAITV